MCISPPPILAQILDPQQLPYDAVRWYNATDSKLGFVDAMWDGDGALMHKELGTMRSNFSVPQLERPRDWAGARVTHIASLFWPQVAASFQLLNSALLQRAGEARVALC